MMFVFKFFLILVMIVYNECEDIEIYKQTHPLPRVLADIENCPLNACEAIKIISQFMLLTKPTKDQQHQMKQQPQQDSTERRHNNLGQVDPFTMEYELQKRVRQIESRLRSVEQPIWQLTPGSQIEWNHCTSGICRCNPDTKSFTCWNTNLKSVPISQIIPMNMVYIDLSRNTLSTLNKETFRGLTLLKELDLSNNILDFLPFDLFQDLDSLVQLRLQNNQLEEFDPRTFWKLRNLNLLDLSKNVLRDLHETILNHIQRLTVVNLSDNRLKSFPPELLKDQLLLEELDVSRNEISSIKSGTLRALEKLAMVDFSRNLISNISDNVFEDVINLKTLILHSNRITFVSQKLFANLHQLVTLDLTMNRISKIDGNAFGELANLRELFLGQNALSIIPQGLFVHLEELTRLTLFSNNLTKLESYNFVGLKNVKNLMLNNNILKNFDSDAFYPLINLEKLRIDSNKLQYLPQGSLEGHNKLIAVKLDKNPWHCDCRALYLARWIRSSGTKLWDGQPMCRGPGDLGGNEVGLLRYDDLCDGQWASMMSLSPRLPVRKHRISTPMNYTDYFNLYLKHIYPVSTEKVPQETTTSKFVAES